MLRVLVLGSAAGGGFPQWNCNCEGCRRALAGDPAARPRTQSSLAVTSGDGRWLLLNASPDLRHQIVANQALHGKALRGSPVVGAVLTNADIDHVAGLLTLREMEPLAIYATPRVQRVLAANSVFQVLNAELVARRTMELDSPFVPADRNGVPLGIEVEAFAVPGKVALYLEDPLAGPGFGSVPEDTVALRIRDRATGRSFFYLPGCASMPGWLASRLSGAELVFFDGTTWTDDEMIRAGVGTKTAQRMGHMSMSGHEGSIAAFAALDVRRRVFIHINNTNPALLEDSPERASVQAAGWEIAYDGMEITL